MNSELKVDIKGLRSFSSSELTTGMALFALLTIRYVSDKPGLARLLVELVSELNTERQLRAKEFNSVIKDFYLDPKKHLEEHDPNTIQKAEG